MVQQYWVVICIALAMMVVNGHVEDLRIGVTPMQSRFTGAQSVNVILEYSNLGNDTMNIYEWNLPEKTLCEPLFEVTRNGEPVEYVGPMFKRRTPTADDIISLAPGMTMSTTVDVSTVYDMTKTGNYMIQYKRSADQVLATIDNMRGRQILSHNNDQESTLQSIPVVVFAVGQRNALIEQANEDRSQMRILVPTYIRCTGTQSHSIKNAVSAAENYANNAVQYFNGQQSATTRYTTWFGKYTTTNWATLKTYFKKIQVAVATKQLVFDCSCPAAGPGTFAYVYANSPYKIYLCGAFWNAKTTGTDSMGGTIIHELAHFKAVVGTQDYGYGQSNAKALAQSNPAKAMANSDNFEYFVENNPRLS